MSGIHAHKVNRHSSRGKVVFAGLLFMLFAVALGCGNSQTDRLAAQRLLEDASIVSGAVTSVEGSVIYPLRGFFDLVPSESTLTFMIDNDNDIATSYIIEEGIGDEPPIYSKNVIADGEGYLLVPVPADIYDLPPGEIWQHMPLAEIPFEDDGEFVSALTETICVLAPYAFPAGQCNPLTSIAELADNGVNPTIVALPTVEEPLTVIEFQVSLKQITTVEERRELKSHYGPDAMYVSLNVTVGIDNELHIRKARFDPKQVGADILLASGKDRSEIRELSSPFPVVFVFDDFGLELDIEAPPAERVLSSEEIWQGARDHSDENHAH